MGRCHGTCLTRVADILRAETNKSKFLEGRPYASFSAGALFLFLVGCDLSPEAYESDPVKVQTRAGIVTCQLYTRELVVWDRAIDRPDGMSVATADAICVDEGKRRAEPGLFTERATTG